MISPKRSPFPVISVGNIHFGGSEKTQLSIYLLRFLIKKNLKAALITRGYKGKWEKRGGIVSNGKKRFGSWKEGGDEPVMISQNIPEAGIFVGRHRLASCFKALKNGFEIAVLDDGFQHRKLHRDLDIVLLNPQIKALYREPFFTLSRADYLLVKKPISLELLEKLSKSFPETKIFTYSVISAGLFKIGEMGEKNLTVLQGKRVLAISGIARPERFFSLLEKQGIVPFSVLKFPDHFHYPPPSIKKILTASRTHQVDAIITTEKDSVKLKQIQELRNTPVYFLKIDLAIEDGFYGKILSSLEKAE